MCFSAAASFTASGVVSVSGVAALSRARKPSHLLLGAIPFFFAIHQFGEGMLWLALSDPLYSAWQRPGMFTFLIVARVVWPVWVPLTMWALEPLPTRRKLLAILTAAGAVLAVLCAYGLVAYPVSARIVGSHVQYRLDSPPLFRWVTDVSYAVVTVVPPLMSGIAMMRFIGLLLLGSLVISKIFFYAYFFSVWCFFAALISVMVVLVIKPDHSTAETGTGDLSPG
jgi:hypothetical protein